MPFHKPPSVVLLAVISGSSVIGLTILTPALPLIKQGFAATDSSVQLIISVYVAALALAQLVLGPLSDRYGRRPILLTGAALIMLGGGLALLANSITTLIVARAVQGIGAAASLAMGRAMINDCFERQAAAQTMSAVQTVQSIIPMAAIAAGGILAQYTSWHGGNFVITLAGLIAFLISLKWAQESNNNPIASIKPKLIVQAYQQVLANRLFLAFAVASGLQVGTFICLTGIFPYQYQRLGVSPIEFGFWFSLTPIFYFLGNLSNRLYFVHRGIERASLIGCSLTLVSLLLMTYTQAMAMPQAIYLALPSALFGFSSGIVVGNSTIGAISACKRQLSGTASGITGAWQMASGALAGSAIIAIGGAESFLTAMAVLIVMSIISIYSIHYAFIHHASVHHAKK